MKLSSKTRFALRILLHITSESRKNKLSQGRDIAKRQGINEPYLEQIMMVLKKNSLVSTVRGRNGGYKLARQATAITLREIIVSFEGNYEPSPDSTVSPEARAAERIWDELTSSFLQTAEDLTLAHISDNLLNDAPDYVI